MKSIHVVRALLPLFGVAALLAGCGTHATVEATNASAGTARQHAADPSNFVVEAHHRGQAGEIRLLGARWGRLVDVLDADGALQFRDFVVPADAGLDGTKTRFDVDPVTGRETLTILHDAGTAEFRAVLADLDRSLPRVAENGTSVSPSAMLTVIPRDAALVLEFDDLLDASTITASDVAVLAGSPPLVPHAARVIPDPSHGDLLDADGDGVAEFHTTRVIVDMAVSELEAMSSNPPLPVDPLGLPESRSLDQPNVLVRIPTRIAPSIGQHAILANLSGAGLRAGANGPSDSDSATQSVVRAMCSANGQSLGSPGGFLSGTPAPAVVGVQTISLSTVVPAGGANYVISASFATPTCAPVPKKGDVVRVSSAVVAVVTSAGSPPSGGTISNVAVRLESGNSSNFVPGPAQYEMRFDPSAGLPPPCFVRIDPPPAAPPDQGVDPNAKYTVRFSNAMDPASVSAFETFGVTRVSNLQPAVPLGKSIVGKIQASPNLREFTFVPQVPLEHDALAFPTGEDYRLTLAGGPQGVRDLSGQPLADALPAFLFRLDPSAAAAHTRCLSLKFDSADEDGNGAPELRGQFLFDLVKGTIRPRPVVRFSAVADASQPVIGLMTPFTSPVQPPLSNLGSKLMTVYRYHDLGFGLVDDATLNVDIEGLAWAPLGAVQVDHFSQFRMAFCHSKFLPDEFVDPMILLPWYPLSGLVKTFDQNQLDPVHDRLKVVHPKNRGYDIQPVDAFVSATGTLMMPYPLNRGVPPEAFQRYTFRDTGLLAVGGANSAGVETAINMVAQGTLLPKLYLPGKVPTLGLPLLMEFRCYPDDQAFGLNGFKVNLALNSSARPAFRAFSAGSVLPGGGLHKIDPDNEPVATGGSGPGQELDSLFYVGQADFVVRVNRVHSIWLDTLSFTTHFLPPVLEPESAQQPDGTRVTVAMRGALLATNGLAPPGGVVPRLNATAYDPYGDPRAAVVVPNNFIVIYPNGPGGQPDNTWKNDLTQVHDVRMVQLRITLISNADTLATPELSGLGVSLTY